MRVSRGAAHPAYGLGVGFIDERAAASFWDEARRAAAPDQQTGYLQDEWPGALGRDRFRGEWRVVSRWLDDLAVARGSCLDVGCGTGVWLAAFARRFERVHGVDLSAEMVASARARAAANVTVTQGSIAALDGGTRHDLVFVGGVLMYVDDERLDDTMARLAGLVAPGGALILRESAATPTWHRDRPLAPGLHADRAAPRAPYRAIYREPSAYRALAARHGLEVARWRPNRHYTLADLSEAWLRAVDRVTFGALAKRRGAAEKVARALHALRWLTLYPAYPLARRLARITNWWTVLRPRT